MKFTPELSLKNGELKPLVKEDTDKLFELYQNMGLSENQRPKKPEDMQRLIELSAQMAATQRGIIWLLEIQNTALATLNLFDWHPSQLRASIRMDACPTLEVSDFADALSVSIRYLNERYHLSNFCYPLVRSYNYEVAKGALKQSGFIYGLTKRQASVIDKNQYEDVELYHKLLN